jgi:hypothetical protein
MTQTFVVTDCQYLLNSPRMHARCQNSSCFNSSIQLTLITSAVWRLLKWRIVLSEGVHWRTVVLHSPWLTRLISWFSQKHRVSGIQLTRTTLTAAIYCWVKRTKKEKFSKLFRSGLCRRKIRPVEWRENLLKSKQGVHCAFFMLKVWYNSWNIRCNRWKLIKPTI